MKFQNRFDTFAMRSRCQDKIRQSQSSTIEARLKTYLQKNDNFFTLLSHRKT